MARYQLAAGPRRVRSRDTLSYALRPSNPLAHRPSY